MVNRERFYVANHQGKANGYILALTARGYKPARIENPRLTFGLFDLDSGRGGQGIRPEILYLEPRNTPIFLYPHAARPMVQWDGMISFYPKTRCNFVIAEGHKEVMRRYGYPLPVEVCGWTFCKLRPFKPVISKAEKLNVLFMPIHPNRNGYLCPADLFENRRVFEGLLRLPVKLKVRYIASLHENGIWEAPNVDYVAATPDGRHDEIDQADVVVATQTAAYIAIARGKPCVMTSENIKPHSGNADDNLAWVKHWELYREYMRYPFNFLDARDPMEMLLEAAASEEPIAEWKRRFIGNELDGEHFVDTLEKYL